MSKKLFWFAFLLHFFFFFRLKLEFCVGCQLLFLFSRRWDESDLPLPSSCQDVTLVASTYRFLTLTLSIYLSLSLAYTQQHTNSHIDIHTQTPTLSQTLMHTSCCSHTCTLTISSSHTCTLTISPEIQPRTHFLFLSFSPKHKHAWTLCLLSLSHLKRHSLSNSHLHSHTCTHMLSFCYFFFSIPSSIGLWVL